MKKVVQQAGLWFLFLFTGFVFVHAQPVEIHTIKTKNSTQLKDFFRYTEDRIPFVSAHRGGAREGFPENCIATFENTLKYTPALLEVDPQLTKDSVVILMHDFTLNRTSTGSGRISDYTWAELQKLKLKDPKGNVTEYRIPTLDEAIKWAKGKTILILDEKSVPTKLTVGLIEANKAEGFVMIMPDNNAEAKKVYELNPNIMMEVFVSNKDKVADFEKTGVPWENVVAFVQHSRQENAEIYSLLHERGAMAIIGTGRKHDREYLGGKKDIYDLIISDGADIIEADYAIEAGSEIMDLAPAKSSKSKYFKKVKLKK